MSVSSLGSSAIPGEFFDFLQSIRDLSRQTKALPETADFSYLATSPHFRRAISTQAADLVGVLDETVAIAARVLGAGGFSFSAKLSEECGVAKDRIPKNMPEMKRVFNPIEALTEELLAAADREKRRSKHLIAPSHNSNNSNSTTTAAAAAAAATGATASSAGAGPGEYRPQRDFPDPVDNSNRPWIPWFARGANPAEFNPLEYRHIYEDAIQGLLQRLPHSFPPVVPQMFAPLDRTPCTWVDTPEMLHEMISVLGRESEIAVDLEAHSMRSFMGFTCLMQISTRKEDFLIDTIELRAQMHELDAVFANPGITKVLHGADSDILWLQRDFGLYIVNMFDTGQAARVLDLRSFSLAHLLHVYCAITADKRHQTADWRQRPLPAEMLEYARLDTHALLYIYDRLRRDLSERSTAHSEHHNLMRIVLQRSNTLCLRKFEKELLDMNAWRRVRERNASVLTPEQESVFAALYIWRDTLARELDESTGYLMPNAILLKMAETLPSAGDIATRFHSFPLIKQHAAQLGQLIARARTPGYVHVIPNPYNGANSSTSTSTSSAAAAGTAAPMMATATTPQRNSTLHAGMGMHPELVSPIDTRGSPRHMMQLSPVLTTEQLYQTAGWNSEPPGVELNFGDAHMQMMMTEVNTPARDARLHPSNEDGSFNSALFESDESDGESVTSGKHRGAGAGSTSSSNAGGSVGGAPHISFTPYATADTLRSFKEDMEREALAALGAPMPLRGAVASSMSNMAQPQSSHGSGFNDEDSVRSAAIEGTTRLTGSPLRDPHDDGIPRSFSDIYRLSNNNRKRNKAQKKGGQGGADVAENMDMGNVGDDDDGTGDMGSKKKNKSGGRDDAVDGAMKSASVGETIEFMTELGWVQSEDDIQSVLAMQRSHEAAQDSAMTGGSGTGISAHSMKPMSGAMLGGGSISGVKPKTSSGSLGGSASGQQQQQQQQQQGGKYSYNESFSMSANTALNAMTPAFTPAGGGPGGQMQGGRKRSANKHSGSGYPAAGGNKR